MPRARRIGYECESGHVNAGHHVNHATETSEEYVCLDCGAPVTKALLNAP